MVESIKELRIICQKSREGEFYYLGWVERNLHRGVSIYITKLFLKLRISANQTTILGLLILVAAGTFFFIPGKPWQWIVGSAMIYFFDVFDRVDGEIARYNKSASLRGKYLDVITYFIGWPFVLICMSFGLYSVIQHVSVFIIGFLAVTSFLLFYALQWLPHRILHEEGSTHQAIKNTATEEPEGQATSLMNLGRTAFSFYTLPMTIMAVSIIDYLLSPIAGGYITLMGSLAINARYLYLVIYGAGMLVAMILRISYALRGKLE